MTTPLLDLRSDTVTRPTEAMRIAMRDAPVGDDVFRDDPTVAELERLGARVAGKAHSLFVASGTMGNLASFMAHCDRRGSEIIMGSRSHTFLHEQGGVSTLASVSSRQIPNLPDGTMRIEEVLGAIQPCTWSDLTDDAHYARTAVVSVENTQNDCGGVAIPASYGEELRTRLPPFVKLHMDGARAGNAAVAMGIKLSELCRPFDSISLCLSKGLGAPVGSLVASDDESFIARVRRARKALGGGWRQAGVLAAAGILAIEGMEATLRRDHAVAKSLAERMKSDPILREKIELKPVHTNMLFFKLRRQDDDDEKQVSERRPEERSRTKTKTSAEDAVVEALARRGVLMNFGYSSTKDHFRCVIHRDVKEELLYERFIPGLIEGLRGGGLV